MKHIFFLFLIFTSSALYSQTAGIISSRFQLSGILNGERVAWESEMADIYLNKSTGELNAAIAVDNLILFDDSKDFEPGSEKDQDKFIVLRCQLPIDKVMENRNETILLDTEVTIEYNDEQSSANFSFTILALPQQGFSIIGRGLFNHSVFKVEGV